MKHRWQYSASVLSYILTMKAVQAIRLRLTTKMYHLCGSILHTVMAAIQFV